MNKKKIIVVIPAYNCANRIEGVFERTPKDFLKKAFRFVIINDGSKDRTQSILLRLKKKYKKILIVHFKKNRGYAMAQKTVAARMTRAGRPTVPVTAAQAMTAPQPKAIPRTACGAARTRLANG